MPCPSWFRLAVLLPLVLRLGAEDAPATGGVTVDNGTAVTTAESAAARDARLAWWRDAKFGMFIHWGVYAVPAKGEWLMHSTKIPVAQYREYAKEFTAAKYDPNAWAALARQAGMKYLVITAKHHDGFALFPSKASSWNAVEAAPAGRDLIGPLERAVRQEGLRFGLYYSQAQDWTNPGGTKSRYPEGEGWDPAQQGAGVDAYLAAVAVPQVAEILSAYRPDILWWDTPTGMTPARVKPFQDLLRTQPGIITNNRLGGRIPGDTRTPEQFVPITGYPGDWETCMTINNNWGYNAGDQNYKGATDLIRKLADICAKGGNLLLNVGPDREGVIPAPQVERLQAVGRWMDANGESIYGTRRGPFSHLSWGCATRKGNRLYLHVFTWPAEGRLAVPLSNTTATATLLRQPGSPLIVTGEPGRLVVSLPAAATDPADTVVVLDLPEEPRTLPLPTDGAQLAASSTITGSRPDYVLDGTGEKRWRAADGIHSAQLTITLAKAETIASFGFDDPDIWPRVKQGYRLEAEVDGTWKTVSEGRSHGHGTLAVFVAPVTARVFRLTVENEKGAPEVAEIQLNRPE